MKVNIGDIDADGISLDMAEDIEGLNVSSPADGSGTDVFLTSPVDAHLVIKKSDSDIFVTGNLDADAKMRCARCLAEFKSHIHSDINLVLLKAVKEEEKEKELHEENLDVSYYAGEELDITEILREHILLELPIQPLCKPLCRGLCPKCGADLNKEKCSCPEEVHTDSRLMKLKEFKAEKAD